MMQRETVVRRTQDLDISSSVTGVVTSIPLVLPNDLHYDASTNNVQRTKGVKRTHLVVVPDAIEMLSKVTGPVGAISISGLARTGKSYILSRLLGTGDAFSLGHTMDPHTFGIWIGTKALIKDGFTVLLLDTEGIDAFAADKQNDVSLLALTLLLSSTFIFNTQSVPKQGQLDDLQCFVEIAKSIRVKQSGQNDYEDLPKVFPDFLWLLRDVHLVMTDEQGQEMDARSFLVNRVLKKSNSFAETTSDKVARAIETFFPSLDCICLPTPSQDPDTLKNIAANEDKLTVDFNNGVQAVIERIWNMVKPKLSCDTGRAITGTQLAALVETYTEDLNDPHAVPVIQSSLQISIQIVEDKALKAAFEIYEQRMSTGVRTSDTPLEEGTAKDQENALTLYGLHKRSYNEAEKELRHILTPLGGELAVNKALIKFREEVVGTETHKEGIFAKYVSKNHANSKTFCGVLLKDLYDKIQKGLHCEGYTYTQLRQDLAVVQANYSQKAKGPARAESYQDFLLIEEPKWTILAKKDKYDEQKQEEERKSELLKSEIHAMDLEATRMQNQMYDQMQYQQQQLQKLQDQYENEVKQAKEEERERMERDLREQIQQMNHVSNIMLQGMQQQMHQNADNLAHHMTRIQSQQSAQRNQMVQMVQVVQQRNAQMAQQAAAAAEAQANSGGFGFGSIVKLIGKGICVAGAAISFVRPFIGLGMEFVGDAICYVGESMEPGYEAVYSA